MRWFRTKVGTLNWSANGSEPLNIDRGNYLRRLVLKLSGTFTLAAGAAGGTARSESPANIIREIRVIGNDIGEVKSLDGSGLYLSTLYHNRVNFPSIVPVGDVAAQTLLGIYTIDFALPAKGNRRPADTFLDTRIFSTLKLEVKWSANLRDATRSGNDRTETLPVVTLDVFAEYERPHTNFGVPLVYMQYSTEKAVTVAADKFEFPLSVDEDYKNIIITAQNKAAAGQYTGNDAILENYKLQLNANVYPLNDIDFVSQQYLDALDFEMDAIHTGANMNQFDLDKSIKESLSTFGGSTLKYVMKVTNPAGDNLIRMYPGVLRKLPVGLRRKVCVPAASVSAPIQARNVNAVI